MNEHSWPMIALSWAVGFYWFAVCAWIGLQLFDILKVLWTGEIALPISLAVSLILLFGAPAVTMKLLRK